MNVECSNYFSVKLQGDATTVMCVRVCVCVWKTTFDDDCVYN